MMLKSMNVDVERDGDVTDDGRGDVCDARKFLQNLANPRTFALDKKFK